MIDQIKRAGLFVAMLAMAMGSCKTIHQAGLANEQIRMVPGIQPDTTIERIVAPYRDKLETEMNVVIGYCSVNMPKQQPESMLGNFMADAIHQQTEQHTGLKIDFAVQNYGGIRIPYLPAGNITVGKIYELMPFDNSVAVVELDSATVFRMIQRIGALGGWPVSGALRYEIENQVPVKILLNGKPIDNNRMYKVAVSSYLAMGGDKMDFLESRPKEFLNLALRDIFIESIKELTAAGKTLDGVLDGRIKIRND